MRQYWSNPWQLFRPQVRRLFVGPSGAGAGTEVALTGQAATGAEGSLSPSRNLAISGLGITGAEGALALSRGLGITGLAITGLEGALNPVTFTAVVAEPVSDTTPGAWLPSTPAAPLYSMIDETVVDDADYDYTGSLSTMRLALGTMTDPSVNYGHRFIYRIKGDGSTTMIVRIGAGATTVATYTHSPAPASLTTYEQMFTSAQVDAFRANSGYTGGWIEFEAA
jgi:hypothetical protein